MSRVIVPGGDRTVHISEITKGQLAAEVNRQSKLIEQQREQIRQLGRVLLAIVLEPESYHYLDGSRYVERTAVDAVKKGTSLQMNIGDTRVVLEAILPEERPMVATPHIVIPPGHLQ
jgi:hypothetical protein